MSKIYIIYLVSCCDCKMFHILCWLRKKKSLNASHKLKCHSANVCSTVALSPPIPDCRLLRLLSLLFTICSNVLVLFLHLPTTIEKSARSSPSTQKLKFSFDSKILSECSRHHRSAIHSHSFFSILPQRIHHIYANIYTILFNDIDHKNKSISAVTFPIVLSRLLHIYLFSTHRPESKMHKIRLNLFDFGNKISRWAE